MSKLYNIFFLIMLIIYSYLSNETFKENQNIAIFYGIAKDYNLQTTILGIINYIIPILYLFDNNHYISNKYLIIRMNSNNKLIYYVLRYIFKIVIIFELLKCSIYLIFSLDIKFSLYVFLYYLIAEVMMLLILLVLQSILKILYESKLSLIVIISLIIFSIPFSNCFLSIPSLSFIAPFNIVMMSRHEVSNKIYLYDFWGLIYLLILIIIECIVMKKLLNKNDWL